MGTYASGSDSDFCCCGLTLRFLKRFEEAPLLTRLRLARRDNRSGSLVVVVGASVVDGVVVVIVVVVSSSCSSISSSSVAVFSSKIG
jgi:hypothetical protein